MKKSRNINDSKLKIVSGLLFLVVMLTFILGSCSAGQTEEQFFLATDKVAEELYVTYTELLEKLLKTPQYMYSAEIYVEDMSNFDYESKEMPHYKTEAEKKKWYKPKINYLYIVKDGIEYVKISYLDMKRSDSGELQYEDDSFKKPMYTQEQVAEYWLEGDVIVVKVDDVAVYSGELQLFDTSLLEYDVLQIYDIALSPNLLKSYVERYTEVINVKNSLFFAENKKVFADKIMAAKCIDVISGEERVAFRNSPFTSGYAEDFSVEWENIDFIDLYNICITSRKQGIAEVECNNELIASYKREITQIWNNETVVNWYGDRIHAERVVMEITYDSTKNPIIIP